MDFSFLIVPTFPILPSNQLFHAIHPPGHYREYISARDSLINLDNANKILEQQFQYECEKKTAATQAEQAIKDALAK